ncbi:MAG TPA: tRNA-dihydrouridine synthase [Patescibacteria group bacterium]|nr:tRNA-dihydrouridine synthase [Patescibacteria group bacterium]
MQTFWQDLPRPFTVLAPLDGVTDVVFRQIITDIGKPDVLFTEFTPVEGFVSKGRKRVEENFLFTPSQKPIIAQIWGTKPEQFYIVAKELSGRGFVGIDINMGCPERVVVKNGACSALIKNPSLAAEIIQATKEGAGELPVSVKTRIGFSQPIIDEWIRFILQQNIAALTVHLRTVAEMSAVDAHWELMTEVMRLRDEISPQTIVIGNGDITSLAEIEEKYNKYGCDGFMVGRGIFANPWIFNKEVCMEEKTVEERVSLYLKHIDLFEKQWKGTHNFALLKKFAKTYISNFPEASELRVKLMESKRIEELRQTLLEYTNTNQ